MTNYEKLEKVLTELFQLDKAELDFGIYRIMNQKRDDVLDFLKNKLPKEVRTILESQQKGDATTLKKELDDAIKMAKEFDLDPDTTPKVLAAKAAYESAGSIEGLEQEVFSHLANFFKRYYEGGDFISLRRYKQDLYAIPYEGEEVKLHWANHDQYYIKTSENLKNYAFKIDGNKTVRFTLKEANTEQNNNKTQKDQERRFALYDAEPVSIDGDVLHLNFTYEPHKKTVKQDKLLEKAVEQLTDKVPSDFNQLFSLAPTEKNKKRTLVEKHLNDFSARNIFDYFIHKDLGGFLTRELDFYIKNEVLFIDDINTDNEQAFTTQLSKIRALKQVASKIITFLAQLENFQKKLWLKKKFVVSCDYCITLDKIPESYYDEVVRNDRQLQEWKTLFNVNIKTLQDLQEEPYLVLDTKFFKEEFKDKLLAEFDDLDDQTDGLMINSDNFQALNILTERYHKKLKAVYIDPPYNTDASSIVYKNNYKDSSWLSLMADRVSLAKHLMTNDGIICTAIDDEEVMALDYLLKSIFEKSLGTVPVRTNPAGRKTKGKFAPAHEYSLFYGNTDEAIPGSLSITEKRLKRYPNIDENGNFAWANFIRSGTNDRREDRPKSHYPIAVNQKDEIRIPKIVWNNTLNGYDIIENIQDDEILVYPITTDGNGKSIEKRWQRGNERVPTELEEYRVRRIGGKISIDFKTRMDTSSLPVTWWDEKKYASANYGAAELKELFDNKQFDFPKARKLVYDCLKASFSNQKGGTVIDFFAGSATTGHAIIEMNRLEKDNKKYILVEMGEYFNTVTKPRIQKVIYSDNWKNGRPQDRQGISQMFKYFNLESYEDALNNLQLKPNRSQQQLLNTNADMQEEYLLQYMLDAESREHLMNIEAFKNPFNYKLNITENNELIPTTLDLIETFNYLIGLHVKRVQRIGAFKTVEGINNAGDKALVIWRNLEESNNEDLNIFVKKMDYNLRDGEFDTIYVNGDNNLANLRQDEETWKVLLLEEVFFTAMFDNKEI
jgi:adenine-specific DNA-methyltransferase